MVRVQIVVHIPNPPYTTLSLIASAEATAAAVNADMMDQLTQSGPQQLHPDHVYVLLQNFGHERFGGYTSFLHSDDAVDVDLNNDTDADWPLPDETGAIACAARKPLACFTERLQPWMTNGKVNAKAWMEAFLAKLKQLCDGNPSPYTSIYPSRFDFDTEFFLATTGNPNLVFMLKAMMLDGGGYRWTNTPVPGSDGKTMAELWSEVQDQNYDAYEAQKNAMYPGGPPTNPWTSTAGPEDMIHLSGNPAEPGGFEFLTNRDVFLWASPIFQRAVDALMDHTAHAPIRDFADLVEHPITCSNYGDTTFIGNIEKVDWVYDLAEPVNMYRSDQFPRAWRRDLREGIPGTGQHGFYTMALSGGDWFLTAPTSSSGQDGAPVFYLAGNGQEIPDVRLKV